MRNVCFARSTIDLRKEKGAIYLWTTHIIKWFEGCCLWVFLQFLSWNSEPFPGLYMCTSHKTETLGVLYVTQKYILCQMYVKIKSLKEISRNAQLEIEFVPSDSSVPIGVAQSAGQWPILCPLALGPLIISCQTAIISHGDPSIMKVVSFFKSWGFTAKTRESPVSLHCV